MDYQFETDYLGNAVARCEDGLQVFGDWLSHDIAANQLLLSELLGHISQLEAGELRKHQLLSETYCLELDQYEARLVLRDQYDAMEDELPEGTELEDYPEADCGLDDLKRLLLAWQAFV